MMKRLPEPQCRLGYSDAQIREIFKERVDEFYKWMSGQSAVLCTGTHFCYEHHRLEDSGEGPHGIVFHRVDVERFLDAIPRRYI